MQALAGRKDAECPKIQGPARAKLSKPDNRPSPVIPLWKIKRELTRLSVQARAIPLAFYEPFVQRRHDASRPTEITATKGTLAATSKLAIFLIYQPDGVASSKDDAFEDAARVLLKDAARTKNYIGASPIVALTSLGLPVIKKNNEHLYVLAREKISEAHANGRLPDLHSEVAEELERKLRR